MGKGDEESGFRLLTLIPKMFHVKHCAAGAKDRLGSTHPPREAAGDGHPRCPGGLGEKLPQAVGVTGRDAAARGAEPLWGGRQADGYPEGAPMQKSANAGRRAQSVGQYSMTASRAEMLMTLSARTRTELRFFLIPNLRASMM